jgi:hypothetical protein
MSGTQDWLLHLARYNNNKAERKKVNFGFVHQHNVDPAKLSLSWRAPNTQNRPGSWFFLHKTFCQLQ